MSSFFDKGWIKILKIDFDVKISEVFIQCADHQLSPLFVEATGLKIDQQLAIRLRWLPEEKFSYQAGDISRLATNIALKYGKNKVFICWKSRSGRLYKIDDENIDCNDIEFWFEGLDPELCRQLLFPKWSLITFKDDFVAQLKRNASLDVSEDFLKCADKQLSDLYLKKTGLSLNKHVVLTEEWTNLIVGEVSSFYTSLTVNAFHNAIKVCWKSTSGKIYKLTNDGIDCNDIEFWFEGLNPVEYHKQLYPDEELPFKLKNLGYELKIDRLNTHATIDLFLKEKTYDAEKVVKEIDNFLSDYNKKSIAKDRLYGVIHNWHTNFDDEKISYEIDLGSADVLLFKKLFNHLSKIGKFKKVEVG